MTPAPKLLTAGPEVPLLSAMRERRIEEERPLDRQQDDDASCTGYLDTEFGDPPVDQITKPVPEGLMDLLLRCPRNVLHAIRRASLAERIARGEKPADRKPRRLARRTINAKGLDSISDALSMAEKLGPIAVTPLQQSRPEGHRGGRDRA